MACYEVNFTFTFLDMFANMQKATVTFFMSVCPSTWNNLAATGQTFVKCDISVFFEVEKIQVSLKSDKTIDALYEDL